MEPAEATEAMKAVAAMEKRILSLVGLLGGGVGGRKVM